jgi:hypothetical protein
MWWIEHARDIAEAVALLCAGAFFGYKAYTGYLRVNLSLSIQCQRHASATAGEDYLAVSVRLAKGANGSLTLHDVKARIAHHQEVQFLSFTGVTRSECVSELQPYARKVVDWSLSAFCKIPAGLACVVEVVVLGQRTNRRAMGQWKASCVSLPIEA